MTGRAWEDFSNSAPELAQAGYALLYQFGIGLGFIATVRKDGGPRVHPCCPIIHAGHLYVFITGNSPKRFDLDRNQHYALHSNPCPDRDDEFYVTGTASRIRSIGRRADISSIAEHHVRDDEVLYELSVERALHTTWKNPRQPDTEPVYTKWQAGA